MKLQVFRLLVVWLDDKNILKSKVIHNLQRKEVTQLAATSLNNPFVEYVVISDNFGNSKKLFQDEERIKERKNIRNRKPPVSVPKVSFNPSLYEKFLKWKIKKGEIIAARYYKGKWYLLKPDMVLCLVDIKCLVPIQWKMAFWYDENCKFLSGVIHKDNIDE